MGNKASKIGVDEAELEEYQKNVADYSLQVEIIEGSPQYEYLFDYQ